MIYTYHLESALDNLEGMIPKQFHHYVGLVRAEIDDLECEEEHRMAGADPISRAIRGRLQKMRLGVYDEERHGNLREMLEELEGLL